MHIVVVTRHLGRAAFLYAPVLRALSEADASLTLVGPPSTETAAEELNLLNIDRIDYANIRPFGESPVPLEWTLVSGRLIALADAAGAPVDVVMSFEEDLAPVVGSAGRAAGVRLIVSAASRPERSTGIVSAEKAQRYQDLLSSALAQATDPMVREALRSGLQQVVQPAFEQVVQPALQQVVQPALKQAIRSPLRKALQERLQEGLQQVAMTLPQLQPALENARGIARQRFEQAEVALQFALPVAKQAVSKRAKRLKRYLVEGAPTHWLLAETPGESPAAGFTDFGYGVGIDVESWLQRSEQREFAEQGRPVRVGIWRDPWGHSQQHVHLAHTLRETWKRSSVRDRIELVECPNIQSAPSMLDQSASYLASLDVAIVPSSDLYAAMQAQGCACLVVTAELSPASKVVRSSETGYILPYLDAANLGPLLESLAHSTTLATMQAAARRRALRYFDTESWIRRLSRNMDEHLTMDPEDDFYEEGDDDFDLDGPLGPQVRRHI